MSDDSFIREVDEELRSERIQQFWSKYGKLLIGAAVAVVIGVGGYKIYEGYVASKAAEAGDAFMTAVRGADSGKTDEALTELSRISQEGTPAYAALAGIRRGAELSKQKKWDEAVAEYDKVAAGKADEGLRALASLRAAALLVDHGSVADVEKRVGSLSGPGAPFRASAREYLALAHFKAGDLEKSAQLFQEVRADSGTPQTLGQRALLMLELIASKGGPAVVDTAPAQTGH